MAPMAERRNEPRTRANSGWRATAPTLKECTIEFELVWKPGDPVLYPTEAVAFTCGEAGSTPLVISPHDCR